VHALITHQHVVPTVAQRAGLHHLGTFMFAEASRPLETQVSPCMLHMPRHMLQALHHLGTCPGISFAQEKLCTPHDTWTSVDGDLSMCCTGRCPESQVAMRTAPARRASTWWPR
jgi:hypothetical protein